VTLTELKYIIAIAQTKHFGQAAELCHVSQPSLSVAVKKLESELGVKLFERKSTTIMATPLGRSVIEQAQRVLEEVARIHKCVEIGKDPLSGPLRLGVILTVAPFLLPELVARMSKRTSSMPLILTEEKTQELIEELKTGQIDAAIMALPIEENSLSVAALYEEEFLACLPLNHPLAGKSTVNKIEIRNEPMLLLGQGHCLRDQVLDFCYDSLHPDIHSKRPTTSTSLETIVHMVAQGLGTTLLPASASSYYGTNPMIRLVPFTRVNYPKRTVGLVWRKTFPRIQAIAALAESIQSLELMGCKSCETGNPEIDALRTGNAGVITRKSNP